MKSFKNILLLISFPHRCFGRVWQFKYQIRKKIGVTIVNFSVFDRCNICGMHEIHICKPYVRIQRIELKVHVAVLHWNVRNSNNYAHVYA